MRSLMIIALMMAAALPSVASWLSDSEMGNGWYKGWTDDAMAQMKDMPFVIGVPAETDTIAKAHKQGTRVLVYVTFYQMPPGQVYQHEDLAKHPDWNIIRPDGEIGISVFEGTENTGWKTVCPNSPGFRDYALRYTRFIMDQGADGIFIDNGHPAVTCEGPKFGKHKHIYPGKDNMYAYRRLLEDIRALVKSYGKDKVVIVNPGVPNKAWVGACDGQMLESYICTWAAKNRWHSESQIVSFQQQWGAIADKGDAVLALSYVGHTSNPPREDAFYCYAWARLSGFIWADWFTAKDVAQSLYKLRLGKALGPMQKGDGYYMREFEKGIVVASSESRDASITLSGRTYKSVYDLFAAKHLKPGPSGDYVITLDKGQGRVYLYQR